MFFCNIKKIQCFFGFPGHEAFSSLVDVAVLQPSLPVPIHKENDNNKRSQITVTITEPGQTPQQSSSNLPPPSSQPQYMSREQQFAMHHKQQQQQQQQQQVGFYLLKF
jgi:hypothetical protein